MLDRALLALAGPILREEQETSMQHAQDFLHKMLQGNPVQQASQKQQLDQAVDGTPLASAFCERSGRNSLVVSTLSSSSSMEHAGHLPLIPGWAVGLDNKEVHKRLANRSKICAIFRPSCKQGRLGRSGRSGRSASHQPHGLPKWPTVARR